MRRLHLLPALVVLSLIVVLMIPAVSVAQVPPASDYNYFVNHFETTSTDTGWFFFGTGTPKVILTDATPAHEGNKCLNMRWYMNSDQPWGGFFEAQYMIPRDSTRNPNHQFLDFGTAKFISLWYNVVTPAHFTGMNHFRFTIHEGGSGVAWGGGSGNLWEDWIYETTTSGAIFDSTPGWHQLLIPLKDLGKGTPSEAGFSLPGWAGENPATATFEPDRILGYSLIGATTTAYPGGVTMVDSGTIQFDGLQLVGYTSAPLEKFDAVPVWTGNWHNGSGSMTTTDTTERVEGTGALRLNYVADFNDSWGSAVNTEIKYTAGNEVDWTTKKNIVFYLKNIKPNAVDSISKRLSLRFILFDKSSANEEDWFSRVDFNLGKATDWVQIQIPLVKIDSVNGTWNLKPYGFVTAPGQPTDDGIFNLNKIGGYKLEISGDGNGAWNNGTPNLIQGVGSFLIDFIGGTGVKAADQTPPVAPTGVAATSGKYVNLVTWNDVPGEAKSKYNIFYSGKGPITDTKAADVEDLPPYDIPLGTMNTSHVLRSAVKDTALSFWYGVTAKDSAGNIGLPGTSAKITNTAKGVPTISKVVPAGFAVDGNLSEWVTAGIKPILISKDSATAHNAPNTTTRNDADLSAKCYIAMDANALYVAFDVVDDIIVTDTVEATYLYDSPDLFLGLYDFRGVKHVGYTRGARPDYHFRFNFNSIRIDNDNVGNFIPMGTMYSWKKKTLTAGYTCEARIPWTVISASIPGDVTFSPVEGMRIPIDFSINDRDDPTPGVARHGILCYSPLNDDNSWADQFRWTYTWIGNKMQTTAVEQTNDLPKAYELTQNYPNPFNPTTNISYNLEKAGMVTLKVYDILGREVTTLVNEMQNPGTYKVTFDGSVSGKSLASGVYFYKIQAGSFSSTKKMMLLK